MHFGSILIVVVNIWLLISWFYFRDPQVYYCISQRGEERKENNIQMNIYFGPS